MNPSLAGAGVIFGRRAPRQVRLAGIDARALGYQRHANGHEVADDHLRRRRLAGDVVEPLVVVGGGADLGDDAVAVGVEAVGDLHVLDAFGERLRGAAVDREHQHRRVRRRGGGEVGERRRRHRVADVARRHDVCVGGERHRHRLAERERGRGRPVHRDDGRAAGVGIEDLNVRLIRRRERGEAAGDAGLRRLAGDRERRGAGADRVRLRHRRPVDGVEVEDVGPVGADVVDGGVERDRRCRRSAAERDRARRYARRLRTSRRA